jgi:hypothetical protein
LSAASQVVDEDVILLQLVKTQSDSLVDSNSSNSDTIIHDLPPCLLCIPLMYIAPPMPSLRDTVQEKWYSQESVYNNALEYIIRNHADLFVSFSDTTRLKELEMGKTKVHRAVVRDNTDDKLKLNKTLYKNHSHWKKGASVSLQITQNYATNNWHQGAVNSFALFGNAKGFINYKYESLSFENSAEWRIGLSTVSGDTVHKMNTTDDRIQLYSKFGYQLHKQWYVSMFADFKTNLFPNYQKNSNRINTTFLTPIRYTMGVGVDCKVIKGLNINFSPATYKLVYAMISDSNRVDVTDYGIKEHMDIINEIGSSLRVEWKWKPITEIELETKFYFFTNYKQVETELEVNVDFMINRFLSAKLMLHPRYDGTIEDVTDQKSKMQFKEVISVGFAHTFK